MSDTAEALTPTDDTTENLTNQTYSRLLRLILEGDMPQGTILRERALATRLGVSRTPLREALQRLEGERWLVRPIKGILAVASISADELMDVLHVRKLLESEAAGLAAGRLPAAEIDELRKRISDLQSRNRVSRIEDDDLDDVFHSAIGQAAGNKTLARVIFDMRSRTRIAAIRHWPERVAIVCAEHLAILDAIAAGDARRASQAMSAHVESARQHVLHTLERTGVAGAT
ncbi:MAG TPA: GntR family transcriptional regulator [Bauldia sp.]|nr:GntR family transcriptional regulator [Bauldia sp.]